MASVYEQVDWWNHGSDYCEICKSKDGRYIAVVNNEIIWDGTYEECVYELDYYDINWI